MNKMKNIIKKQKVIRIFIYLFIAFSLLILSLFFVMSIQIGKSVKKYCDIAKAKYEGDCVESLIELVEDDNNLFRLRNSAIWSLGQLGDPQALPALEKLYTGNIPKKESFDLVISQYELKKAINLVKGGLNLTSFVWRRNQIFE